VIQNILFPIDFSPSCAALAPHVKRAAAIFGAEVTLLHACDLSSHNGFELYVRPADEISQEHWALAQNRLESFLTSEFPPSTCLRILKAGNAGNVIVELATKSKFDLIMMPTHAGRVRRTLLGSTTAKVLNDAACPVLTTQHAADIPTSPTEHRRWICAVELRSDAERVVRYARDAALTVGAKLSLIHVIHTGKVESGAHTPFEEEQNAQQRIAQLQSTAGSVAAVCMVRGAVKETLLDAVRQASADVLVIGRTLHAGALGRMRDLTYSLICDSPCPVVSV